jgi:lipopolysaccharide/colanic/teichoic acid biosynthesis glycosyltransferase
MTLIPDYRGFDHGLDSVRRGVAAMPRKSAAYHIAKRVFDIGFSTLVLLPAMLVVVLALLLANPFYNPGPLFYAQKRMGRDCKPFRALKFRSMRVTPRDRRGPDDPVDLHRITPLGHVLRRSRFDELPQILNVYRGDMSLIGPRPDYFRHAHHYMRAIPDYRARHMVRPGISGLAQIRHGYAEGMDATRRKTGADLDYIRNASLKLDLWIFWRTIVTVVNLRGT